MRIERVRTLSDRDRETLLDFWVEGWTKTFPEIDFAAQRGWLSDRLDALMSEGAWLLLARACEASKPAGFLTVHPESGTVDQLAVDPAHGGQGFGRALLDEAKRLSPGGLNLRVTKANSRAFDLYRRAGFDVSGEDVSARSGLPIWTMRWHSQA